MFLHLAVGFFDDGSKRGSEVLTSFSWVLMGLVIATPLQGVSYALVVDA